MHSATHQLCGLGEPLTPLNLSFPTCKLALQDVVKITVIDACEATAMTTGYTVFLGLGWGTG